MWQSQRMAHGAEQVQLQPSSLGLRGQVIRLRRRMTHWWEFAAAPRSLNAMNALIKYSKAS